MTTNPFDGRRIAFQPGDRAGAVGCVERSWTDMRPKSLVDAIAADDEVG
jgi:uncharacterized protein YbdZ (MbtH family)